MSMSHSQLFWAFCFLAGWIAIGTCFIVYLISSMYNKMHEEHANIHRAIYLTGELEPKPLSDHEIINIEKYLEEKYAYNSNLTTQSDIDLAPETEEEPNVQ